MRLILNNPLRAAIVLLAMFIVIPSPTFAGSAIPNLTGTWMSAREGIKLAPLPGAGPDSVSHAKIGFQKTTFTFNIEKQEGRCFSGFKSSAMNKERFAGCIGFDNKSVYMADEDGTDQGTLVGPDKMELYYLEANGRHGSTAAVQVLTRQKQ